MIGGSFLFLKDKFPLIYSDCERMEKNLVEGDGIESIMLAGRICERITKTIFEIENFDYVESQFKRIQKLDNVDILPKGVKDNFNQVRMLRNDVYHRDVAKSLSKSSSTRTYDSSYSSKSYHSTSTTSTASNGFKSSSTRTYDSNKSKISKSIGELSSAKLGHKMVFNICVWFYGEYGEDKSFTRPFYKIGKRSKDMDLLIRLKHAVIDENDFKEILIGSAKDNKIVSILKELRGEDLKVKVDNPNLVYKDNNNIKIRKANKPYSECMGISYDDELFMWKACYGDKELGLFNTSKEAYVAREVFLNSIPVPKLNSNGKYSKHIGISFSKVNKMWTVSAKGVIVGYSTSEKDAILMRDKYYKKHGLVIKYKNKDGSISFNKDDDVNKNNNLQLSISNSSNSNKSKNLDKLKKNKSRNKSKNLEKSKIKVKAGKRVNKSSKKAKKDVKVNRKASKYDGVYYEEGLFMWSAEVDGKELGLFASEEEAKKCRDDYINSKN